MMIGRWSRIEALPSKFRHSAGAKSWLACTSLHGIDRLQVGSGKVEPGLGQSVVLPLSRTALRRPPSVPPVHDVTATNVPKHNKDDRTADTSDVGQAEEERMSRIAREGKHGVRYRQRTIRKWQTICSGLAKASYWTMPGT